MADTQFTPIVLDPSTNSVSGPVSGLPPRPVQPIQPTTPPIQQTVPLQPVPMVAAQPVETVSAPSAKTPVQTIIKPATVPAISTQPTTSRQTELQQQLETLSQEENKLLGTIKDWVAWIQGAETKKQALERELAGLNTQFNLSDKATNTAPGSVSFMPTAPTIDRTVIEKQLREAEAKLKTVVDQQKIEEKKAFDNYSAGGINREGLLKEMERISAFYNVPLESAKAKISELHEKLNPVTVTQMPTPVPVQPTNNAPAITPYVDPLAQPVPAPIAQPSTVTQVSPSATIAPATASITTPPSVATTSHNQKILDRLRTLSAAQTGYIKQLLVDLPNQGTGLTVERAADGNGVIILAGSEQAYTLGHHFPDADLILAGLGADDITTLPTGTLVGSQITPPAQASL